ncbi:hypothetical protein BDV96DRAFT_40519 [Lophiotrema nucula]|uniref:Uncharacterized protein n=1 Tax=Lophiotrema nucula TaxID=690887 RepID=A0A6A5ZC78_9PLEO|nr:hypothetical protein BDV96DRAFT_40519 [Lophiotrema nucula]
MKSDDAYEAHLQRPTACDVRPEPAGDNRISQKALKRLDFKKAPYAHAASVEDKWKIMYKRLFPNDRDVPSAFDQCGMSPRMERALAEALEEQLTSELTPVLEPILRRIKDRIPMIIESCRMKLMQLSSDDEVVLATSGTPSTNVTSEQNNSNSDSDRLGSNLQTTDTSRSVSRCSVANLVSLSEGDHTSKAKGKRAQRAGSDASRSTLADGSASCHSSSPESVFDKSLPSFGTVTHQQTNQTDLGVDVFDFQLFPDNTVNGADHAASPPFDYPGQELGYSTTFDGFQPQDGGFSIAGPPTTIGRYPTVTNLYFGGTSKQMTSSQVQYHPEPAIPVQQLSGTSDLDSILDDFDFERFFNNA